MSCNSGARVPQPLHVSFSIFHAPVSPNWLTYRDSHILYHLKDPLHRTSELLQQVFQWFERRWDGHPRRWDEGARTYGRGFVCQGLKQGDLYWWGTDHNLTLQRHNFACSSPVRVLFFAALKQTSKITIAALTIYFYVELSIHGDHKYCHEDAFCAGKSIGMLCCAST